MKQSMEILGQIYQFYVYSGVAKKIIVYYEKGHLFLLFLKHSLLVS